MEQGCRACGSPSTGTYVCHYCGAAKQTMTDPAHERMALDELHGRLAAGGETSEAILQNAFVPTNTEVLIDAGLRLLPVLEDARGPGCGAGGGLVLVLELTKATRRPVHVPQPATVQNL